MATRWCHQSVCLVLTIDVNAYGDAHHAGHEGAKVNGHRDAVERQQRLTRNIYFHFWFFSSSAV